MPLVYHSYVFHNLHVIHNCMSLVRHLYVTCTYVYFICMSLVMFVNYVYALACHLYVTCMSSVCHLYVLVCYAYAGFNNYHKIAISAKILSYMKSMEKYQKEYIRRHIFYLVIFVTTFPKLILI